MYPVLITITDSLAIHSYGVAIAIGIIVAAYFALKDPLRKALMSADTMTSCLTWLIISAIAGGRVLFLLSEPYESETCIDMFAIWDGGLSVLGAIIAGCIFLYVYTRIHAIPLLPTCDLAARYAPIAHMFGRIGCFFAGCCTGMPTTSWFSIIYTDPLCLAPLNVPLHPTQLYSAATYLLLFGILYLYGKNTPLTKQLTTAAGITTAFYLIGSSIERFFLDFIRGDRTMLGKITSITQIFSVNQLIALSIICLTLLWLIYTSYKRS